MKTLWILLLLFFVTVCYGQEASKQETLTRLEAERTAIKAKIAEIEKDPVKHADDKIKRIDEWLPKLPDRTAKEGRITMKQYLQNIKADIAKDKAAYSANEVTALTADKVRLESRIDSIEKEVNDELIKEK